MNKRDKEKHSLLFMFDVILIMAAIMLFPMRTPFSNPNFVPTAIACFTTISGILTAFVGYWLSRQINKKKPIMESIKETRILFILILMFGGLLLNVLSIDTLVYGTVERSYFLAFFGTWLVILSVLEVLFLPLLVNFIFKNKK